MNEPTIYDADDQRVERRHRDTAKGIHCEICSDDEHYPDCRILFVKNPNCDVFHPICDTCIHFAASANDWSLIDDVFNRRWTASDARMDAIPDQTTDDTAGDHDAPESQPREQQ